MEKIMLFDPQTLRLLAMGVLGLGLQWMKGQRQVPNYLAYPLIGALACFAYIWATPDFSLTAATWRDSIAGVVMFLMAARGAGSTLRDMKLAPATNTLGPLKASDTNKEVGP